MEIYLNGGTITNAFGGGNNTSIDVTDINLQGSTVTNIYGGSNQSGNISTTDIDISGGTTGNVYGGNNAGGITNNSNVLVSGAESNVENVYGGGNQAPTGSANVTIKDAKGPQDIYGGGKLGVVNNNTNVITYSVNSKADLYVKS